MSVTIQMTTIREIKYKHTTILLEINDFFYFKRVKYQSSESKKRFTTKAQRAQRAISRIDGTSFAGDIITILSPPRGYYTLLTGF